MRVRCHGSGLRRREWSPVSNATKKSNRNTTEKILLDLVTQTMVDLDERAISGK